MKKKILIVGLIGLLLAGGLVLAGCGRSGCPRSGGDCSVSIDSSGNNYTTIASCGNGDCAVNIAYNKKNPGAGKYTCDCR
jgi:hypothetical protein